MHPGFKNMFNSSLSNFFFCFKMYKNLLIKMAEPLLSGFKNMFQEYV